MILLCLLSYAGMLGDRCLLSPVLINGTGDGTRTRTKLFWQKTDYCCSFHTFWVQKCYPPSTLSLVFVLVFPISTVTDIDESRPCLLNSNYFTLCNSPYLTLSCCVKPASCGSHSLQTVVPDELFHFVKSKLAHWVRVCTGGFSPNTRGSRYTLPEVPFSRRGLVSIPL